MESDWVKIYTSTNFFQAELVKQLLTQHEIEVVLMNKRDSAHNTFGQVEVYIHQSNFSQAIEILVLNDINP
ncbi:putative signal transducing protein [Mucilaginibacter arboris]|uniref:DUF2007 domain-containing protein n=1 Tax=Mucilaginibacter arboris TaxID=2682090 RepID=A0A7K1SSD9_9SPHI|nr:DUF2007 domain-containing protein [Mucilaginibacter arboris]MVN20229.1 hypothetical protein [Mucilaginibacter arboris]